MVDLTKLTDYISTENKLDNLSTEILCQPHVPKPLHGVNPRSIMSRKEWDSIRFEAQRKTNYTCVACGINRVNIKDYKWLEGHEKWHINYNNGCCEVTEIVPLCRYCHLFIHSGFLKSQFTPKTKNLVLYTLNHGFSLLKGMGLKVFISTFEFAKFLRVETYDVGCYLPKVNPNLKWSDYYLFFEGKKYFSKFKSKREWEKFYNKEK